LILKEKDDHEKRLYNGKLLGEVIVETAERFKTPIALPLMDLTVEKEWMLSSIGIQEKDIEEFQFTSEPNEISAEFLGKKLQENPTARLRASCEAIEHTSRCSGLIPTGMVIGPFSLMVKLIPDPITGVYLAGMGMDDQEVKTIEKALELANETILQSIKMQVEAGAKAICVCEPAANTVYVSPIQLESGSDIFDRYVMNFNMKIKNLLNEMNVDLIFHNCGELNEIMMKKFNNLDSAILSLGASRTLWEDAKIVSKDTVLFGNLPSKKFYSDKDLPLSLVREMSENLIEKMKEAEHPFILGTECDVLSVPEANESIMKKIGAMLSA
jgi:uroporphyrinogen-III decarboxylase